MDKRTLLGICIAAATFIPFAAPAQTTIYKQVDEEGRVLFTDQPRANARTLSSYQTGARPASRLSDAEVLERVEGRRSAPPPPPPETSAVAGLYAPLVEPDRRRVTERESPLSGSSEEPRRYSFGSTFDSERARMPEQSPEPPSTSSSPAPSSGSATPATHVRSSEVERAVFSYAPIASPAAAQVDATEAGRRARQEASKASATTPVLKVTPLTPDRPRADFKQGVNIYYTVWALTFLIMAAGLLYVGWQVMRLILGEAFPRWHIGAG